MKKILFPFLTLCISACSVGPDYKSPEFNLPEDYYNSDVSKKTAEKETDKEKQDDDQFNTYWWQSFNDPVLTKLIIEATNSNLDLKQAFQRLNIARANARSIFQDLFPRVDIFGNYQKTRAPALRFPGSSPQTFSFEIYSLGLDASWEIDVFGKLRRLSESQGELRNQQFFLTANTLRILQAEIATNYIQYRLAQIQRKIAEDNLEKQKSVLNLLKQKLEFGDISPLDFERTNALTSSTEALIPQYKSAEASALYRLATLLGSYIKDLPKELLSDSNLPTFTGASTIGRPTEIIRRRPDILAAEAFAKSQNAKIGASIANLFPIVSFAGSLSEDGRQTSDFFTTDASAYVLAPRITWSIINIGTIIQDIKASKARSKESIYAYKQTILNALEEIETSLVQVGTERDRKVSLNRAFNSSTKVSDIAQDQYNEGLIDNLELIDAQQSALNSESQLRESQANLALSYVRLFKALSGGWEEEEEGSKNDLP